MRYPEVTRLYKYHAFNERSLALLIDKSIWVSKPDDLNDPFEVKSLYDLTKLPTDSTILELQNNILKFDGQSNNDIKKQLVELAGDLQTKEGDSIRKDYIRILTQSLKQLNKDLGIYSLSRCYQKKQAVLMWSHYSGSHTGFVIGFERNPDKNTTQMTEGLHSAEYVDLILRDINDDDLDECAFRPLVIKSNVWKYEDEYRIIYSEGNKYYGWPGALGSITFGLRMPMRDKLTIYNALCGHGGIHYYDTTQPENRYSLEYKEINDPTAYFKDYVDRERPEES